jgi:hypothetical protein
VLPTDRAWPSPAVWSAFSTSLGTGVLIEVVPPGAPCYNPTPTSSSQAACTTYQQQSHVDAWRVTQPGAMMFTNFEDGNDGTTCQDPERGACNIGNVASWVVSATTEQHVRQTLAFASQHNVRLIVKSTGHDTAGRSTAFGALVLWMPFFSGPNGRAIVRATAGNQCGESIGPSVEVGAGTLWKDVYTSVHAANYVVVGGAFSS